MKSGLFSIKEALLRAPAEEHDGHGAKENLEVEPQRPAIDVLQIELHPVLEIADCAATPDLPKAGQPRTHTHAATLAHVAKIGRFVERQGTRPDQAHLAPDDIPKLR